MADPRDPAKKGNPRYAALTGGETQALTYYYVRRRLGFTVKEWDELPAWQGQMYLDGLEHEFSDKGNGKTGQASPGTKPGIPVDYADGSPLPRGFSTRRAG